jgi:hypothetical protein
MRGSIYPKEQQGNATTAVQEQRIVATTSEYQWGGFLWSRGENRF